MHQPQISPIDNAYARAAEAFQAGRFQDVEVLLAPFVATRAPDPRLYALLGFSRIRSGNFQAAAEALSVARRLDPKSATFAYAHGDALLSESHAVAAESAYRAALALEPSRTLTYIGLSMALSTQDRHAEALEVLKKRIASGDRDHQLLVTCATVQTALSQLDEALATSEFAAKTYPGNGVALHNLAAAYGDLSIFPQAADTAAAARARGQTGPVTWLVEARALQGMGRLDEAARAYDEILRQAPEFTEALREQAQMIWMRTGDLDAASQNLAKAVRKNPTEPGLALALAKVRQFGGDLVGARELLAQSIARQAEPQMAQLFLASEMAVEAGEVDEGLRLAQAAVACSPELPRALYVWCDALLAAGRAEEAVAVAEPLYRRDTTDQNAIIRYATALRLKGDERYKAFFDYETLVRPYRIEAPKGWSSVADYLKDLKAALMARHTYIEHPFDQSLRHGGQAPLNLAWASEPAISAFAAAIDAPIRQHIAHLKEAGTALGERALANYQIIGAWSVLLRPNGYHWDHIHHLGWLSSAFYIEVPEAPRGNPHEGSIKFGEPGTRTTPKLGYEHIIRPEPGTLVLFPSYMWHGTVPFTSDTKRMTLAFDVRPKP